MMGSAYNVLNLDDFGALGLIDYTELILDPISNPDPSTTDILQRIFSRRPAPGYNCNRFVERVGGEEVPISFYEPDPETARNNYYYNSRRNVLYMRIKVTQTSCCPHPGQVTFYWKPLSDLCNG